MTQAFYWVETKGRTLEAVDAIFEGNGHSDVPDLEHVRRGEVTLNTADLEHAIEQRIAVKTLQSNL
jgi:hypothetical protein